MNAPAMLARLRTPQADGLVLRLTTLTPLYTGGIGQLGDQVHPSNLLGGIRQMSCLVARTLGDGEFEAAVWGNPGSGGNQAQAKQVALRWDTSRLERRVLPPEIRIARGDGGQNSRWWFNTGFEGELSLQLTRRGIAEPHWHLLALALAIQLRHGSFGAKDQFGLGVLAPVDNAPLCAPLDVAATWPKAIAAEPGRLNLLRFAYGRLRFRSAPGQRPSLNRALALKLALATRATLRNALRARPDAAEPEKARLTALRHQMLGKLNLAGSAVNISAAYATADGLELRLSVALKPATAGERNEVRKAFSEAAGQVDSLIEDTGYRVDGQKISLDYGQAHAAAIPAWLNQLAGV